MDTVAVEQLDVSHLALSRVISRRAAISAQGGFALAQWLDGSAALWLHAQILFDLWRAESKSTAKVKPANSLTAA